jgi:predicted phosphodiesterase
LTTWAFVSDVHGNLDALKRAADLADAAGAERVVCLGDVVGKKAPDACVLWIRDHADLAIVGNRDLDHIDWLAPRQRDVVLTWTREACASDFVVTHGDRRLHSSLHSRALSHPIRVEAAMAERAARLWLFGHTHSARCWLLRGGTCRETDPALVRLHDGDRYVVNVGTTGMPRGDPASFTLYDDTQAEIRTVRMGRISVNGTTLRST